MSYDYKHTISHHCTLLVSSVSPLSALYCTTVTGLHMFQKVQHDTCAIHLLLSQINP